VRFPDMKPLGPVLLLLLLLTAPARAQAPSDAAACGWFFLTEAGVLFSIKADAGFESEQAVIGSIDLGGMKNIGRRWALGATGFWESGSDHNRGGVRIRYRRWLGGRTALDLSPGVVVAGNDTFDGPGLIGQAAFNAGDLMSVVVEGEVDRYLYIPYYYVGTTIREGAPQHRTDTTFRAGLAAIPLRPSHRAFSRAIIAISSRIRPRSMRSSG
jgi:hypothetical protein